MKRKAIIIIGFLLAMSTAQAAQPTLRCATDRTVELSATADEFGQASLNKDTLSLC